MASLAVAMVVAMEKNIEKKSKKLKFHETSKNHIFRKSIFSSLMKMKVEFFKGLTDISKRRNLDRKICNNSKLLCFEVQKNQKYQLLQKLFKFGSKADQPGLSSSIYLEVVYT